jgi:hypothetical protein
MTNYFERRFNKLKTILEIHETENTINNFQNYIGLNDYDPKKGFFSISVEKISGKHAVHLNMKYTSSKSFDLKKNCIQELPYDINCLISEFLPETIELKMMICYGNSYPFSGPYWELLDCNDKLTGTNDIRLYYNYIIECHNKINKSTNWSPAICIDKDILSFITKINNFEDIKMLRC